MPKFTCIISFEIIYFTFWCFIFNLYKIVQNHNISHQPKRKANWYWTEFLYQHIPKLIFIILNNTHSIIANYSDSKTTAM